MSPKVIEVVILQGVVSLKCSTILKVLSFIIEAR